MRLSSKTLYTSSLLICVMLIGIAVRLGASERAEAQSVTAGIVPFAGQISGTQLCCNGIQFTLAGQYQSVARGTFIFEWYKMIPQPSLGLGLYSWWAPVDSEKTLGSAIPGGTCITIASECESSESVNYSINQAGTTLTSTS